MSRAKVVLATGFVILCWAYSPVGIHIALQAYAPDNLALLRFVIASIFMAGVAGFKGVSRPRVRDFPMFTVLGLFAVTLHHIALNYGQRGVSAGAASVLAQSTPLFSALLASTVFRERISTWQWGCVLGGLLGAGVVAVGDRGFGELDGHGLLILLAAASWSLYFALQKRYAQRYDGLTMVCFTLWSGTALLLVYLPGLPEELAQAPVSVNLAVLVLGIFPSALAYLAWAYVLTHSTVSRAAISLYLIPPVAMVLAWVLLAQRPSMMVIVGTVIVLASVGALTVKVR